MQRLKTYLDTPNISSDKIQLIPELQSWYNGNLYLAKPILDLPGVYSNFVTTYDGRISFNQPDHMGGGDISMGNLDDRRIMGLLRATTDAVLVGANTLRLEADHIWTPDFILRDDQDFVELLNQQRAIMGKNGLNYLHLFVTGSGHVNPEAAVFKNKQAESWFITTETGAKVIKSTFTSEPNILTIGQSGEVDMSLALTLVREKFKLNHILCEGGPKVIGSLLNTQTLNQVFLSIANQIIGNAPSQDQPDRPSWVSGYYGQPGQTPKLDRETVKFDDLDSMEFQSSRIIYS